MEFRIQYMRPVCTHYFPVPVIGQNLGIVHVCVHAFVCESSLHSSDSDVTKFWIVPNPCECLLQHIQILIPTPGNFYKHTLLTLLGIWYSAMGYPHVQILPLFHSASNCPHRAANFHAWMPSSPWLASAFLHKSAYPMWISTFLGLGFYSACLASLLFNILWTKLTLVVGFSALWRPLIPTLALTAHDTSWDEYPFYPAQVLTCHTTHLPSVFLWILSFHPIWFLTPCTRILCLHWYPLHPYHLTWPTMLPCHGCLSW